VAAGIARERAKAAAITGAIAISMVYLLRTAFWLYMTLFHTRWVPIEPWPQHSVEASIMIGGPFLGAAVSVAALKLNTPKTTGFAGINRLHFLWLWFAASLYAMAIVTPLLKWLLSTFVDSVTESRSNAIVDALIYGVPVFGFFYPACLGLLLLAGKIGSSRTLKNVVGPVILTIGWIIATCIQIYWGKLLQWVFG
jgi:hypothetical protein